MFYLDNTSTAYIQRKCIVLDGSKCMPPRCQMQPLRRMATGEAILHRVDYVITICFCSITADYTIQSPTAFNLTNTLKYGSPTGDLRQVRVNY